MARDERGRKIKEEPKREPEPRGLEVYDVMEHVRTGAKRTRTWVRKHPWESAGIAALAGAALAKLLFWKKRR